MPLITLRFEIDINAEPERIWEALWSDAGYRYWTAPFTAGSYAETDQWRPGSQVRFLAPGGSGMYSRVEKHEPNTLMRFKHLGTVKEGVNQPADAESAVWAGACEEYRLEPGSGTVKLTAVLETVEGAEAYFDQTFPVALQRVKERAEAGAPV